MRWPCLIPARRVVCPPERKYRVKYTFDFGWLLEYYPQIAKGIAITLELIAIGGVLGIALGIFCAWVRALGPKWLRPPVATYVELIRNTPFLIQLFLSSSACRRLACNCRN